MKLWQELKRRKVIRVVIAYAIAAWALIEFAATVEEPLGLPLWTDTLVIVLLAIGLPIAIVVSWMFDLGPSGVTVTPSAPATVELEPGRVVGHFVILGRLGEGGMGVVYRARDTTLDRLVALKFLPEHLSTDEDASRRFLHEARAAGNLDHPNICTIHEIGQLEDGRRYIAMPLYEGETLKSLLSEQQRLDPDEAARIGAEIARGLAAAHAAGIVHRDIKPANVVLTRDGRVKILDFGIAKKAGADLTAQGEAIGSVAYMSPEQARGEALDGRSDIWSLGVVLFELCTGTRPFGGLTGASTLYEILELDPPRLVDMMPTSPPGLSDLIAQSLSKDPDDRPGDAAAVAELLLGLASRSSGSESVAAPGESAVPAAAPSPESPPARDDPTTTLPAAGERRLATVLSVRLAGLSQLEETLDPTRITRMLGSCREVMSRLVGESGGVVNRGSGESLQALFGVPRTREDDPVRALQAALELIPAVRELLPATSGPEVGVACGLDTGRVVVRPGASGDDVAYRVSGRPSEDAGRLASQATAGEVIVTDRTLRLVDPFFVAEATDPLPARGEERAIATFRIMGQTAARSRLEALEADDLTELQGRRSELELVAEVWESVRGGQGCVVSISGEAGVGKSRFLLELDKLFPPDTEVSRGRCQASGSDSPYAPFIEALQDRLRIEPGALTGEQEVADRLREIHPALLDLHAFFLPLLAVGADADTLRDLEAGEQLRVGLVDSLTALFTLGATADPCVLLLEDWHWADDGSRQVLRQLVEMLPEYPLLVVVTARTEAGTEDALADWRHVPGHRPIVLGPLSAEESASMIRSAFVVELVPEALETFLFEKSGGNPFFLEELCRSLLEDGSVQVEGDSVRISERFDRHKLPDTVEGVLRTRLDRLDGADRRVLQTASVIGREFARSLMAQAIGGLADAEPVEIERALQRLRNHGLIQQTRLFPHPILRFKHALTRDVAYDSLLERQRSELHGRVGAAIEDLHAERLDEHAERLTEHFARSRNWEKALDYAILAADRLWMFSSFQEAAELQDRALSWLEYIEDPELRLDKRVALLLRQERLFEFLGVRDRQRAIIDELLDILDPELHQAHLASAYLRLGDFLILTRDYGPAEDALRQGLELARKTGDVGVERHLLRSMGLLMWHTSRHAEAVALGEQVLELDQRLGSRPGQVVSLSNLAQLHRALGNLEEALARLEEALEIENTLSTSAPGTLSKKGYILHMMGSIHAELGNADHARELLLQAQAASDETAASISVVQTHFHFTALARLELTQGRVEEAVQLYERCVTLCRKSRHLEGLAISLRLLGEVLLNLGRREEALTRLMEAAELYERMRDLSAAARMWRLAASGLETLGDSAGYLDALKRVVDLADRAGMAPLELEAAESLARGLTGSEPDEALRWFDRALAVAVRGGLDDHAGAIEYAIGVIEWGASRFESALEHFESAHRKLQAAGDPSRAGLAHNSVGRCLRDLGRLEEARTVLEAAVEAHAAHGQDLLRAHALAAIGDIDLAEGRPDAAAGRFGTAMTLREELGDEVGRGWMLLSMARAQRASGSETGLRYYLEEAREVARAAGETDLLTACDELEEQPAS